MMTLPELLRGYVEMQQVMFGVILIAVMAAIPGGLVDVAGRVRQILAPRSDDRVPEAALSSHTARP